MSPLDIFIAAARAVPLETVFDLADGVLRRKQGAETVGPCPACGGRELVLALWKEGQSTDQIAWARNMREADVCRILEEMEPCL